MLNKTLFLWILLGAWLNSCGNDSSSKNKQPGNDNEQLGLYKDQILAGKIANANWQFVTGRLTESSGTSEEKRWSFSLIDQDIGNVCDPFLLTSDTDLSVIFSMPEDQVKVGKTALALSTQTITLLDSRASSHNIIATEGFIELTEVSSSSVKGKMVAHYDKESSVVGHFLVKRCCKKQEGFSYQACEP